MMMMNTRQTCEAFLTSLPLRQHKQPPMAADLPKRMMMVVVPDVLLQIPPLDQLLFVASQLSISPPAAAAASAEASAATLTTALDGKNKNKNNGQLMLTPSPPSLASASLASRRQFFWNNVVLFGDESSTTTTTTTKNIQLTQEEQDLFQLLQKFRNEKCPDTTIRVAGGWVRDKLLQLDSVKDIDIVTSNMSGKQFASLFEEFMTSSERKQQQNGGEGGGENGMEQQMTTVVQDEEEEKKKEKEEEDSSSSSSLLSSGHLETATLKIGNFDIDVCHLRYDKYNDNNNNNNKNKSRIPSTSQIALSVVQDAWRRDLTINSLYYNIHTNQVEDWTERGLQDLLLLRKIATPKQPLPTLIQDPLRILRAIRFAAQFSFQMDPALIQAARNSQVQELLMGSSSNGNSGSGGDSISIVSGTRRAKEINGIFKTNNPAWGIQLLLETKLLPLLLRQKSSSDDDFDDDYDMEQHIWREGLQVLSTTQLLVSKLYTKSEDWNETSRRFLWYAAFWFPYYCQKEKQQKEKQQHQEANISNNNNKSTASSKRSILFDPLNENLKLSKSEIQTIESIIKGTNGIQSLLLQMQKESQDEEQQQTVVDDDINDIDVDDEDANLRWMYYQTLKQVGPLWKESLLLSLVLSYLKNVKERYNDEVIMASSSSSSDKQRNKNILVAAASTSTTTTTTDVLLEQAMDQYVQLQNRMDAVGLNSASIHGDGGSNKNNKMSFSPLLNGSQIQKALPNIPKGIAFRDIMTAQERWQVQNAIRINKNNDNKDQLRQDLTEHLKHMFPQYT
eukprot:scaffold5818_cov84-Cylindrotheca_fusiformis.AAC.7